MKEQPDARGDPSLRTAILFTVLALGFAVVYWVAVEMSRRGILPFSLESDGFFRASLPGSVIGLVLRDFGPALAGVIALAVCQGRASLAELGRSLMRWRVPVWLYFAAWFGIVLNLGIVIAGYATGSLRFDPSAFAPLKFVMLFFVMAVFDGPLGEEIGWRGVLLPQLLRRMSPLAAAIVVGIVWYAWHVPLYAADDKLPGLVDHATFLYTCVALSVIMTWFFLKSGVSTFLMVYLHDASNYSTFLRFKLFPKVAASPVPTVVYAVLMLVLAVAAAVALVRHGQRVAKSQHAT